MEKFINYCLENFGGVSFIKSDNDTNRVLVYPKKRRFTLKDVLDLEKEFNFETKYEVYEGCENGEIYIIDIHIYINLQFDLNGKTSYIYMWVENNNDNDSQPIEIFNEFVEYIKNNEENLNVEYK